MSGCDPTTYDPETCITAGWLRAIGFDLDDEVPDCAWVPRAAVQILSGEGHLDVKTGTFNIPVELHLTRPMQWISIAVELPEPV